MEVLHRARAPLLAKACILLSFLDEEEENSEEAAASSSKKIAKTGSKRSVKEEASTKVKKESGKILKNEEAAGNVPKCFIKYQGEAKCLLHDTIGSVIGIAILNDVNKKTGTRGYTKVSVGLFSGKSG